VWLAPSRCAEPGAEVFRQPTRLDGFAPIADYAVLGNGSTVALVALDGQIDWWPLPRIDSPPIFAALLDARRGGHLNLCPQGRFEVSRRYLPDSNVLETTFRTDTGTVTVTDALTVGRAGRLPWAELVRCIQGVVGEVALQWEIVPGDRFGLSSPKLRTRADGDEIVVDMGELHLAVHCFDVGDPKMEKRRIAGTFSVAAGTRSVLAITGSESEPLFFPSRAAFEARVDTTVAEWHEWSKGITYDGDWEAAVRRSAFALKLLLYAPTGAIAAAATTSLPERIGGDKNWDYRYLWVRDAAFTVNALINLGLDEEVQAAVSFLLRTIRASEPNLHIFYALDGSVSRSEREVKLPGYRSSKPVRVGNDAEGQLQLGVFGDLFDTIWNYVDDGHLLDQASSDLLADIADRCCKAWRRKDAGIWELDDIQHYTISKMGCWVALDRAVRLNERGQLESRHARRWARERDAVKAWVDEHCWSEAKSSYTFYAGTDQLDAATLLAGRTGFDRGERLAGTIAAVCRELVTGPLVYRYSGARDEEGAFLSCSFWLVGALANVGKVDEARSLMDDAVALGNDVGLFAEQMDPASGAMLGNYPQGLSHLALIDAALCIQLANTY
jgi:GH15 family glucan-1,4-alpha-glucosidase